ncbi:MAG: DUF302 domain-containing protein [Arenicellales bacterium]
MKFIRNLLALIGVAALVAGVYGYQKFGGDFSTMSHFDPQFKPTFSAMWEKLKETGNSADATVWIVPLEEGVSAEDAEEAMKIVANDMNIMNVGEQPLSEQVALQSGVEQRFLKIFQFCDPATAMRMVEHTDAFAAYLPCRIALVQGKDDQYRLYALNMDLMIYGGAELPAELKADAIRVKEVIQKIMASGASGDFF